MSALDDKIDDLYKLPLDEFTAARNALAKSLGGDDGKRVKALAKPNLVPWAVNQVYWRARGTYDRLLKAGERLRKAQIAALEGRSADVRGATDAHRHAIADAVAEAGRLAGEHGSKPSPDALTRTFEALSIAPEPAEPHGRLTEAMQPAGFEALAGVTPKKSEGRRQKSEVEGGRSQGKKADAKPAGSPETKPSRAELRAIEKAEKERAEQEAAAREHDAALKKADAAVARAEANEKLARATWERAHDALLDARKARDEIKRARVGIG